MASIAGQTVLVAGSTGNIGVSAVIAALKSKAKVLALVRNDDAAQKLFTHIGGQHDGVTTVNVDVTSKNGVADIMEQVKSGKLPSFQHVVTSGESSREDRVITVLLFQLVLGYQNCLCIP